MLEVVIVGRTVVDFPLSPSFYHQHMPGPEFSVLHTLAHLTFTATLR